jgi:hypothetical protein
VFCGTHIFKLICCDFSYSLHVNSYRLLVMTVSYIKRTIFQTVNDKVNFALAQAMKAQRGSIGIGLLFL